MNETAQQAMDNASETTPEHGVEGELGFLWDFWYPAMRSDQIYGRHLATTMLLEIPLVVGRTTEGKAFVLRDSCPHRGIPLSYGHFDGKNLQCSYHGWKFDACSGQCVAIPSLTSHDKLKVERISAGHFPCEERDGYVWAYVNPPGTKLDESSVPAVPELPKFSEKFKITRLECDLPAHVDHGIIGLMDPAHGPFVHQSWFWRSKGSIHEKSKQFEPLPNGFRMSKHSPSTNSLPYQWLKKMTGAPVTTTIDFVLPNMRFEEIRGGRYWFSSRATVTPLRRDCCRIDFVAAWNLPLPISVFRAFAKVFLRQDQETMIQQSEGLKHNPRLMLIDDADRPAKWYFALKQNLIESRRTGKQAAHPMDGPVTLHWKS